MPVRCAQSKVCLAAAWAEISAHSATLLVAWFRVGALTEFNKSHGLTHAATAEGLPWPTMDMSAPAAATTVINSDPLLLHYLKKVNFKEF